MNVMKGSTSVTSWKSGSVKIPSIDTSVEERLIRRAFRKDYDAMEIAGMMELDEADVRAVGLGGKLENIKGDVTVHIDSMVSELVPSTDLEQISLEFSTRKKDGTVIGTTEAVKMVDVKKCDGKKEDTTLIMKSGDNIFAVYVSISLAGTRPSLQRRLRKSSKAPSKRSSSLGSQRSVDWDEMSAVTMDDDSRYSDSVLSRPKTP